MFSAIFSFLGGSVFRMLWGEISAWANKAQDHKFEIERAKLQGDLDAAQHQRTLEALRLQSEMGIKVIEAKAEADVGALEAAGWFEAVRATGKSVGVAWVDAWNAVIRPGVATWSIFMITAAEFGFFALSESAASVCFAALGIYLADRTLGKRGK